MQSHKPQGPLNLRSRLLQFNLRSHHLQCHNHLHRELLKLSQWQWNKQQVLVEAEQQPLAAQQSLTPHLLLAILGNPHLLLTMLQLGNPHLLLGSYAASVTNLFPAPAARSRNSTRARAHDAPCAGIGFPKIIPSMWRLWTACTSLGLDAMLHLNKPYTKA